MRHDRPIVTLFGLPALVPLSVLSLAGCGGTTTVDLLPRDRDVQASGGGTSGASSTAQGGRTNGSGTGAASNGSGTTATNGGASSVATGLPKELLHRYDFSGTGTAVADLAGNKPATILGGATLNGSGQLNIADGVSYVELKSWILSLAGVPSITIATWLTWRGGASWQRIFDFGATEDSGGTPGVAVAQFYFTPKFEPAQYFSSVLDGNCANADQAAVEATEAFPVDTQAFVAVVVEGDDAAGTSTLHIYLNGVEAGPAATTNLRLKELRDQNCWLGQSQWIQDAATYMHFNGTFDEFRIYGRALSASEISGLSLSDPAKL